jgi:hypothetical protein
MPAKGDRPAGLCLDGEAGETSPSRAWPGEEVFEVGTGYGYQTALPAFLAARVVSIGIWPDLAAQVRRNLTAQGTGNVVVLTGDGTEGAPDFFTAGRSGPRLAGTTAAGRLGHGLAGNRATLDGGALSLP